MVAILVVSPYLLHTPIPRSPLLLLDDKPKFKIQIPEHEAFQFPRPLQPSLFAENFFLFHDCVMYARAWHAWLKTSKVPMEKSWKEYKQVRCFELFSDTCSGSSVAEILLVG